MVGWIALYRAITEHWVWNTSSRRFQRWVDLLFLASWKRRQAGFGNMVITLERGQLVTSVRELMRRWKTNSTTVTSTLNLFVENGMIRMKRGRNMTIITVTNYNKYQRAAMIAEALKDIDLDSLSAESFNDLRTKIVQQELPFSKHNRVHFQTPIEEDNNIIINNNSTQHSVREENLSFYEDLKNSEIFLDEMMKQFSCTKQQLLQVLETFVKEVNIKETHHTGGFSDFKKHFYDWARIHFSKQYEHEQRKTKGSSQQDKYAARRGTDVGDKKASDYGSSF